MHPIGKKEVEPPLFADDMTVSTENPQHSIKKKSLN